MEIEKVIDIIVQLLQFGLIACSLYFAFKIFAHSKNTGAGFSLKVSEFVELTVDPSSVDVGGSSKLDEPSVASEKLPADYLYLNHVAFIREEKQKEFQERTGLGGFPHYDIRVILDSYYKGALANVKYVEYFLHKSYPEPIQSRSNIKNRFLLKELANGEYVLQAKVHLKNRTEPLLLQRYITLEQDESFKRI